MILMLQIMFCFPGCIFHNDGRENYTIRCRLNRYAKECMRYFLIGFYTSGKYKAIPISHLIINSMKHLILRCLIEISSFFFCK